MRAVAPPLGWIAEYASRLGPRYTTFARALNAAAEIPGPWNLVECGSVRTIDNWLGDGGSTIILARYAAALNRRLFTVDISRDATAIAQHATEQWRDHVSYVTQDSVEFLLEAYDGPVGLLYLDSLDCTFDLADPQAVTAARRHQESEIEAAWDRLVPGALVLLDDNPGKTELANAYLKAQGAMQLANSRQSLWRKEPQ